MTVEQDNNILTIHWQLP